jgi:hypothetical protein
VQRVIDIAATSTVTTRRLRRVHSRTDNNKVFLRTDFNLGTVQLTVRHNYVDALNDVGGQSTTLQAARQFLTTAQQDEFNGRPVNSRFGTAVNEVPRDVSADSRLRERSHGSRRTRPVAGTTRVDLGTRTSRRRTRWIRTAWSCTTTTRCRGSHTYTFGTHNEFFKFRNLFIQNLFGNYEFSSIDKFAAGSAQGYLKGSRSTSDPLQARAVQRAPVRSLRGDQWRMRPEFHADLRPALGQAGLPGQTDGESGRGQHITAPHGHRPDAPAGRRARVQLGSVRDGRRQQVRGGSDCSAGGNPYRVPVEPVREQRHRIQTAERGLRHANNFAFSRSEQPAKTIGSAQPTKSTSIDPDYQFPSIVRGNLRTTATCRSADRHRRVPLYETSTDVNYRT